MNEIMNDTSKNEDKKTMTKERKVGNTTFIVKSSFNDKKHDVIKAFSRLIENDENEKSLQLNTANK